MRTRFASLLLPITLLLPLGAQTGPANDTDVYYMVFLRPAPDRKPLSKEDGERIQSAHMANIRAMGARGVLAAAGPFEDTPATISGIFVMKAGSLDEARRIAAEDPTVVEHRNTADVFTWNGPKGIGAEYARVHKEHPETPEDMGVHPFFLLYRGAASDRSSETRAEIARRHMDNVHKLKNEGKLAAAGAIEGGGDLLGIVIFSRIPFDEARRRMEDDPAVKAGLLRIEAHRWWCSAHVLPW
jgi:uncharacterized protein YciI